MVVMDDSNRFTIKKLPDLPQFEDIYNVKIGNEEYLMDRANLTKLKADLDQILKE